jgi:hypothetical protein
MEYIQDDQLKSYLKRRLLSIDEGVILAKFLLHMEQFLLQHDLVHTDIKPDRLHQELKHRVILHLVIFMEKISMKEAKFFLSV